MKKHFDLDLCSISTIKELMGRHGLHFSKARGQNFLIQRRVPERIAESTAADAYTGILEIGPGVGCLTRELSKYAGKVVAVEVDRGLEPLLAETVGDIGNIELIFADILKLNIPELVNERFGGLRVIVCANLPYNITTPVLTALFESKSFESITVMVQREVARRITAAPGCADYGAFTVYANWHAVPEILFDVPPGCFIPPPKVHSSVLKLSLRDTPPTHVLSEQVFFRVVRAAFGQRRKTLINALDAGFPELSKQVIYDAVTTAGLHSDLRGEVLSIAEFAVLSDTISIKLPKDQPS